MQVRGRTERRNVMEWITDNWMILLVPVLVGVMYVFGYGCGRGKDKTCDMPEDAKETEDQHKGHGCCH